MKVLLYIFFFQQSNFEQLSAFFNLGSLFAPPGGGPTSGLALPALAEDWSGCGPRKRHIVIWPSFDPAARTDVSLLYAAR